MPPKGDSRVQGSARFQRAAGHTEGRDQYRGLIADSGEAPAEHSRFPAAAQMLRLSCMADAGAAEETAQARGGGAGARRAGRAEAGAVRR